MWQGAHKGFARATVCLLKKTFASVSGELLPSLTAMPPCAPFKPASLVDVSSMVNKVRFRVPGLTLMLMTRYCEYCSIMM